MKNKKGFTLIELVVVMAIIAVLALIVVGAIIAARRTATMTTNRGNAATIHAGAEALFARTRSYGGLGTATQSFAEAAATARLNLRLSPSQCDTVTAYAGGGRILYSAGPPATWTIIPVNHECAVGGEVPVEERTVLQ